METEQFPLQNLITCGSNINTSQTNLNKLETVYDITFY